jgi:hypothetical protein
MVFASPQTASISIDFGTSHTVATIRRADGRVHQQLFDGSPQLPSAVFIDDADGIVVGADAVHSGRRKPERFEPNPKRRIDDASVLLGETDIPVTNVIAAVLSRVARECRQTVGALGSVTVTVPAVWGPTRRHVITDAAAAAELGQVDLVAEPVAAASYFTETLAVNVPSGSGVVVYDLGGGTFDATVLRRSPTGFDVLAVDGADDLGGLDFDQALAEHLAKTFHPDDERWERFTNPTAPAELRHRTAFMDEVRQAKERLSRSASTELTIPLLDVDAHLTREELEQVCAPLVERTIRVTQGVIRESGLAKEQITGLFLVGAASRMPLVATLLHRALGIAPSAIEQPELAVSEGGLVAQHTVSTYVSVPSPALTPQPLPAQSPSLPDSQPTPAEEMPGSVKLAGALLWLQAVLLAPLWAYYVRVGVLNGRLAAYDWPVLGGGSFTLALLVIGGSAAAAATLRLQASWPRSIGIGSSFLAAASMSALAFTSLMFVPMLAVPLSIIIYLSRHQARRWFTEPLSAHTAPGSEQAQPVLKRPFSSILTAILAAVLTLTVTLLILNFFGGLESW